MVMRLSVSLLATLAVAFGAATALAAAPPVGPLTKGEGPKALKARYFPITVAP